MANERTYPALPCADVEVSIAFYESLGFKTTFRQLRPYQYAVVAREDLHIHLFTIDGFNPADSYGTAIVVVPDPDSLYKDFAASYAQHVELRNSAEPSSTLQRSRKLPVKGIPRITRPRKKYGTVSGFSVVDPGGNWLRISKLSETEEKDSADQPGGLAGVIYVAARLGDARGDEALALKTLETGLARFPDAPAIDLAKAYLYRAELAVRTNELDLACASLTAAQALDLTEEEKATLADEFANAIELVEHTGEKTI